MPDGYDDLIPKGGSASATTNSAPTAMQGSGYDDLVPKNAPPPPPPDGNSFWYDVIHPQTADLSRPQSWRDWATKTYDPSAKQISTAALDDASFGTADWAQSKYTGEDINAIRKRTADAQAALGPGAPLVNAATYLVPGAGISKVVGKAAPVIGRYGSAALTGATGTGLNEAGHELGGSMDPWRIGEAAAVGAGVGAGGQAVGDAAAAVVRRVSDYVTGLPGRGSEQWDWRTLPPADAQAKIDDYRQSVSPASIPPGGAKDVALTNLRNALGQSTEPGVVANIAKRGGMLGGGLAGFSHLNSWLEGLGGASIGESVGRWGVDPVARALNTIDRNINVGQAFDKAYPALTGTQSTTDVSGLAPAIRDTVIGAQRGKRFGFQAP